MHNKLIILSLVLALSSIPFLVYVAYMKVTSSTAMPSQKPIITQPNKTCFVGGCSGQLCVEQGQTPIVTNCMYSEAYACYKTASCELQPTGYCGWTPTKALHDCLFSKGSN